MILSAVRAGRACCLPVPVLRPITALSSHTEMRGPFCGLLPTGVGGISPEEAPHLLPSFIGHTPVPISAGLDIKTGPRDLRENVGFESENWTGTEALTLTVLGWADCRMSLELNFSIC